MKIIIGIYFLIGALFSPLIYSNNGGRFVYSGAYGIGQVLGASLIYWPSYVFAWEPEIDGDSDELFSESIVNMIQWRREKLFSTRAPHEVIMLSSIGICMLLDSGIKKENNDIYSMYRKFFNDDQSNTNTNNLRKKTRKRFDGMVYKDVLEEGNDCKKELKI